MTDWQEVQAEMLRLEAEVEGLRNKLSTSVGGAILHFVGEEVPDEVPEPDDDFYTVMQKECGRVNRIVRDFYAPRMLAEIFPGGPKGTSEEEVRRALPAIYATVGFLQGVTFATAYKNVKRKEQGDA